MKVTAKFLIIIFGLVMISCGGDDTPFDWNNTNNGDNNGNCTVINFPDSGLKECMRDYARVEEGEDLCKEDLPSRVFSCDRMKIKDLTGMENFSEAVMLDFSYNEITSIEPLRGLTKLREIELQRNNIIDISPLENKPELVELILGGNPVSSYAHIKNMVSLRDLWLQSMTTRLTDIDFVSNLTNLEELILTNNKIQSIEPIKSLLKLEDLNINNNCVSDLSPIDYLKQNGVLKTVYGGTAEEQTNCN